MRRSLVKFSESEASNHTPSLADFTTTTPELKFSVHTEMRRRSAVEPVIGHLKDEHRMGRNYLAHRNGDLNNAILAAAGYNFRRLIKWLRILWCLILIAIFPKPNPSPA